MILQRRQVSLVGQIGMPGLHSRVKQAGVCQTLACICEDVAGEGGVADVVETTYWFPQYSHK
jgi:hypothetical protein